MRCRELILCVGMHRSGTSLTASILESLGICLPGELIAADAANMKGYFENRSIVDAQEKLLKDLGYWWPTERASRGMPGSVIKKRVYIDYIDWLSKHIDELFDTGDHQIAIKDPRTSLLMPAWRLAAARLGITLKVVICIREPRDVCWSLIWRDGPSVGMNWSRAQRLWMRHYRDLLKNLENIPALVVSYENWFNPDERDAQVKSLANFIGKSCTKKQIESVVRIVKPEINHGGVNRLAKVDRAVRRAHSRLLKPGIIAKTEARKLRHDSAALEINRLRQALRERLHLIWIQTPWGGKTLEKVIDKDTLYKQIGSTSLKDYRKNFSKKKDLRLHPLISPAHLNRERLNRGMRPINHCDELIRHLLYPDMLPLNTHPFFDCREYTMQNGQLGLGGEHPVLNYLKQKNENQENRSNNHKIKVPWLIALGAHLDRNNEENLPPLIARLHPGLILADPITTLGDPSSGTGELIANGKYYGDIEALFSLWVDSDPEGPLTWISKQHNVNEIGLTESPPASGYRLWWITGHWEALVMADLAGIDINESREFDNPQALYNELVTGNTNASESSDQVMIALTEPLLELFFSGDLPFPNNIGILNMVWPRPSQQSPWLHLLARATLIIECRSAVRAYFQSLGFKAEWAKGKKKNRVLCKKNGPKLILANEISTAEKQLAIVATTLDANKYNAVLRLDAVLQLRNPFAWLEEQLREHSSWIWLNPLSPAGDPKAYAVITWAKQNEIEVQVLSDPAEEIWLSQIQI